MFNLRLLIALIVLALLSGAYFFTRTNRSETKEAAVVKTEEKAEEIALYLYTHEWDLDNGVLTALKDGEKYTIDYSDAVFSFSYGNQENSLEKFLEHEEHHETEGSSYPIILDIKGSIIGNTVKAEEIIEVRQ